MILVILGTNDKKFTRLLLEVDNLINKGVIKDEVVVQAGYTSDYHSKNMKIFDLISKDEFEKLITSCDFIITHGGVGTILTGLNHHKKIIAVPRLSKYKEHVNDHQLQIIDNFKEDGYIIGIRDVSELSDALEQLKTFKVKHYKSNKNNMINLIKKCIDK